MKSIYLCCALLGTLLMGVAPAFGQSAAPRHATQSTSKSRIVQILHRLGEIKRPRNVAISPDGKKLAWTLHREKKPDRVIMAAANGSHVRVVSLKKTFKSCKTRDVTWAPSGRRLAFLTNCGNGKAHKAQRDVYLVNADAAQPRARRLTHLSGYAHDLTWSPNGRQLGMLYVKGDTHRGGATQATKARVGVIGSQGVQHQRIAAVDAANGAVHSLTPRALYVYAYSWSPHAQRLVYTAAPPPGDNNWWVAKLYTQSTQSHAKPHAILDPSKVSGSLHGLQIALPRFSPDGSRIALIGGLMSDRGVTGGDIYVIPAAGGAPVNVTPGIGITPSWLTWTSDNQLLVSAFAAGATRVSTFTLHGKSAAMQRKLFSLPASIGSGTAMSALALSNAHKALAFIHSSFSQPYEIDVGHLHTDGKGQPTGIAHPPHAITHINSGVKPLWGKATSVKWTNDGHHVQGWLLYPAHYNPHKHYPMIVAVHGGPSYAVRPRWPRVGYGGAPLSALGYFVLFPNPRGSFGQGEAFTQAIRKDMGYGDLRDILAGVDKVEKNYPVDDNRLGLTGWSYGGFMSMFAPTQTHRFRAVVAGAGVSDWKSYYGENSIDKWMIPFFGASVYDDPKVYAKSSAINFIKQAKAPTLIVVGQRDAETPAPQSFEFWHALRAMHVPTTLVVYPGEGHRFMKSKHRRDVLERALAWFQKYMGNNDTSRDNES